ncbi:Mrp/NBP35 family ATP-binding protein [Candidatus Protochlamydia amoebophila]|nr:Mrp/NBP35 family ATP-binding protein [Candidatus Protochlamydia amoebophila]
MTNKVLAIGSGKEVMDKSTVAVNLAVAFYN